MLLSLYIENIALIQKLNIEPGSGLTVLTGETGAGKTIIVGSLSLLCGARGDRDVVRTGEDHALAEGVFGNLSAKEAESLAALGVEPDDDGLVMLSRRISSDGRSVCRVNGRTVTAGMLKSVGACLLNLHGQQESMQLSDPDTHLPLLDGYAADEAELDSYKTRYRDWLAAKKRLESLENASRDSEERADMLDFQINELEAVSPRAGEYAELEAESLRLGNFEKIAEGTQRAHDALYANPSAYELIKKAESSLKRLSAVLPEAEELAKRADLMLVVGGRHSSNTGKLAEICSRYCRTVFIESASELSPQIISGLHSDSIIGITAGASTPAYTIKEVHLKMSEIINNNENEESFAALFEQSESKRLYNGAKVKATVVSVKPNEAVVELGTKHTGYIPLDELTNDPNAKVEDIVKVGDVINAIVTKVDDSQGVAFLSKKRVDSALGLEKIAASKEANETLEGVVTQAVKGGVIVVTNGTRVFIPASQTGVPRSGSG